MSKKDSSPVSSFGSDDCTFQLSLPSNPNEITKVEAFLLNANTKLHLDDGTMYRILVAVTEAVNNAILHGNKSDSTKSAHVCLKATKDEIKIKVQDEGPGFDSSNLPNPLDQENLLKEHGRGVFLIRSLVDGVEFESTDKGLSLILTVDLKLLR